MANTKRTESRKKYEGKRFTKNVSFNTETEQALIEYANSLDFSRWAKAKLQEEMQQAASGEHH